MKIRTDFVTNSSSSSFVLVLRIVLRNRKVIKYIATGDPEGYADYSEVEATMSPEGLAKSADIAELIENLRKSISVLEEQEDFIEELEGLKSMDEIERITINGDKYGRDRTHQYKHHTYYVPERIAAYDVGGDAYIREEGSGGALWFDAQGIQGKNFGKARAYPGYRKVDGLLAYDSDVEIDPVEKEKEVNRQRMLRQEYADLRNKYLALIKDVQYSTGCIEYLNKRFFGQSFYVSGVRGLGAEVTNNPYGADYLILNPEIEDGSSMDIVLLETRKNKLSEHIQALEKAFSEGMADEARIFSLQDLEQAIRAEKSNGYPITQASVKVWKKTIPFDHITEFPCKGKSIAMAGLEGNLLLHFVKVSKQFDRWETSPTKSWIKEKGGVLKDDVTLKCDYLVVGPSATMDVMKVTKAVRYRDSGKSLIKIIPEDEVLQILDAEDQAISK